MYNYGNNFRGGSILLGKYSTASNKSTSSKSFNTTSGSNNNQSAADYADSTNKAGIKKNEKKEFYACILNAFLNFGTYIVSVTDQIRKTIHLYSITALKSLKTEESQITFGTVLHKHSNAAAEGFAMHFLANYSVISFAPAIFIILCVNMNINTATFYEQVRKNCSAIGIACC